MIETARLRLVSWADRHADPLAAMHADAEVMADQGGPLDRAGSEAKRARYAGAELRHGVTRWALEERDGGFVGYVGVMPGVDGHTMGPHHELGWRLVRSAWGRGYATEAAQAALADLFGRAPIAEVLAYTAPDNFRSQAVMHRLGLARAPERDFTSIGLGRRWRGLVWVARRP